jgi:hypothetical protein
MEFCAFGLGLFLCSAALVATDKPAAKIDVYFSPDGGCTEAVVQSLDRAKNPFSFRLIPSRRHRLR